MLASVVSALLLAISPLAVARPTQVQETDPLIEYSAALERRDDGLSTRSWPFEASCDLSLAQMPTAPTPLPAPGKDQTLTAVMVGRGTQNYTCDPSKPESAPVAIGALATLFNSSCIASTFPSLLQMMPGIALDYPVPKDGDPANSLLAGYHFFLNDNTPFFNLNTAEQQLGTVATDGVNKVESDAPSDAIVGVNGQGHGAVAWLRLVAKPGNYQFKTVYRLNTAGGASPKTCRGMPKSFTVDYSAEYWFWA